MPDQPFVHKFTSRGGLKYVYDVGTQEIVRVQDALYDVLDVFGRLHQQDIVDKLASRHSPDAVKTACKEIARGRRKGIFLDNQRASMTTPACEECIDDMISSTSGKLILNITQDCNFKCVYCAFSGLYPFNRTHSKVSMSEDVAREAIKLFMAMNKDRPTLNISFYGGEPMLEFEKIASLMEFARGLRSDGELLFHIDSNGSILTDTMADFIIEHDIHLQISLDGPKKIHDRYRVLQSGDGTYDIIIRNLEKLKTRSADYYNSKIGFSATVTPPYELLEINDFFESSIVPKLHVFLNFVDSFDTDFYRLYSNPSVEEPRLREQLHMLRNTYIDTRIAGGEPTLVEKSLFDRAIITIHTRKRDRGQPYKVFPPNGICVPIVRRFYVESDGEIFPCERVNNAFRCGTVFDGVAKETINALIDDYIRNSEDECAECWAQRLCGLCFASAARKGNFNAEKKRAHCEIERRHLHKALYTYVSVMEQNADGYDFVKDMTFD